MLRRNFIGSVIGTLVTSRLDFLAIKPQEISRNQTLYERLERLVNLDYKDLLKFSLGVNTEEGGIIWAPKTKEVEGTKFIAEGIEARTIFTCKNISLIDDEGYFISYAKFIKIKYLSNGDILNCNYTFSNLEEIRAALKLPQFELNDRTITPQTRAVKYDPIR